MRVCVSETHSAAAGLLTHAAEGVGEGRSKRELLLPRVSALEIGCESYICGTQSGDEQRVSNDMAPVLAEGSRKAPERLHPDRVVLRVAALKRIARAPEAPSEQSRSPLRVRESPQRSKAKTRTIRNPRYERIYRALKEIGQSRPQTQEEVINALDKRGVPIPWAKPFRGRAWNAGFRHDRVAAGAWLSKSWHRVGLPGLPRGPKSARK